MSIDTKGVNIRGTTFFHVGTVFLCEHLMSVNGDEAEPLTCCLLCKQYVLRLGSKATFHNSFLQDAFQPMGISLWEVSLCTPLSHNLYLFITA